MAKKRNKYIDVDLKKKKTKAEEIADTPRSYIDAILKEKDLKTLRGYVKILRSSYKRRVLSFRKNNLVSHAQIALEASIPKGVKQKPIKDMSINQLILEFYRYSKFFKDKTSDTKGIIEVNRQQDARIFGTDSRGRPKRTMTNEERSEYWSAYEEFRNQYPEWSIAPYSEDVQQILADVFFTSEGADRMTLLQKIQKAKDILEQRVKEYNLGDRPNVFSGSGPSFN